MTAPSSPHASLRWLRWVARGVAALVVFTLLIVGTTAGRVWWEGRRDARPVSDVILVLGAAQYNGSPSEILAARLDHAALLYKDHVAPRIITVGGGQPGDRTTEGASGAAYLKKHGIPDSALVPVPTGTNTYRSLQAAHDLMKRNGWTSAVIVTDPWHALRARTMANDLGIDAHVSPVTTGPVVQTRKTELRYITRETAAFLCYSLFGDRCEKGASAA
ncbi:MAG: hypothetical protein QOC60_625 [Frankiaceae bacterium]|nr:hypothetical protein [Frankiaceae bacterium]MDQ1714680.1 hypothetical protein [Frankiaceae bacterium]